MQKQIANKTLSAIKETLNSDGCGTFREKLRTLMPQMEDAYRPAADKFRRHQGASGIGADCARSIQLKWRWVQESQFDERILRLFNRGHLEEARFLAMLLCLPNVQLWYETEEGGQIKWSDFSDHYGSALDGIALGIPDVPQGEACYTEFKTANEKKFRKFEKEGCADTEHKYYVQCQQCMHYMGLKYTLFMVVNKNTDELYAEIIHYNQEDALKYANRAGRIIYTTEVEPKISNRYSAWDCKYCDEKDVCFGKKLPDINCRTCAHWSANPQGGYTCQLGHDEFVNDKKKSFDGCKDHVYDPTLLPAFEMVSGSLEENYIELRTMSGNVFKQGPDHISSQKLHELFAEAVK